jgi:hypothetical protein
MRDHGPHEIHVDVVGVADVHLPVHPRADVPEALGGRRIGLRRRRVPGMAAGRGVGRRRMVHAAMHAPMLHPALVHRPHPAVIARRGGA